MRVRRLLQVLLCLTQCAGAVATGAVFGSHMVLQRNAPIPVFGTGSDGEQVVVSLGTLSRTTTVAGGKWKVSLDPMEAGGPHTLTIQGTNKLSYTDVMIGEVWHCAGQSNMDTRMNYSEYPNLADSIKSANYPRLRYISLRQPGQAIQWQAVSPSSVGSMTATGYFFGRDLLDHLGGVSVGIVNTSVGGTIIEQWLDPATKASFPDLASDADAGSMYDQWMAPVVGYRVKGTVWLQGENNTSSATAGNYAKRLERFIPGLRRAWGQPDMPFLVAGLCHKGGLQTVVGESSNEALIREAQRTVTDTSENAWLVVAVDLGDDATWHYPQKPQIGARLGRMARGAIYLQSGFPYRSPDPKGCFSRGNSLLIPWNTHGGGLSLASGSNPTGFAVAGSDGKWAWATSSSLKGDTVILSTNLAKPTQVRYAWANQPIMNLLGAGDLPASPFQLPVQALASPKKPVSLPPSNPGLAMRPHHLVLGGLDGPWHWSLFSLQGTELEAGSCSGKSCEPIPLREQRGTFLLVVRTHQGLTFDFKVVKP